MKTVLLIGAGATRAEALAQGASKNQRPPLDGDFFELAQLPDELQSHRDRVHGFVKENFNIDIFKATRPGMEEIFGLVYSSTLSTPLPTGVKNAFSSLCRIYAKVIEETTNWIVPTTKGPLCRLIRKSVEAGPTTIITFNQDIVIEKALDVLTKSSSAVSWHISSGYKLKFSGFTKPNGAIEADRLFESRSNSGGSNPVILKPHGSLNWYAKTLKKDAVLSQLRSTHKINCTRRKTLDTTMQSTTHNKSGRTTWYTWPIIVPPILEKGSFLGSALDSVWDSAWDALVNAERVIVYGYSFPNADAQSRTFFMRTATKMANGPLMVSINPDITSAQRAAVIFSPSAELACKNARDYLSERIKNGIVI